MSIALATLAILSILLNLWQWFVARLFPLHQREEDVAYIPPITLLKPLKGVDTKTEECLRSWLEQDYDGSLQVLMGVAKPTDPACALVRTLIQDYPHIDIQLVICSEILGNNAKVSSLIQLLRQASHEVIIVSDADVRVTEDFLTNAAAPLEDPEVGLVNCFYRLANPATLGMRWEAVAINADFWSQVLHAKCFGPMDFALGAVMITRRHELAAIGGFEAMADHLADDFQMGNRISKITGKRIALCPVVVDCLSGSMSGIEAWKHQLRWARTIRVSKPLPYAFSILGNALLWPLLWAAFKPSNTAMVVLTIGLLVRIASALDLQERLGRVAGSRRYFWLVPVKDLLQCCLWAGAFFGNRIVWRGDHYELQRDGRLVRI